MSTKKFGIIGRVVGLAMLICAGAAMIGAPTPARSETTATADASTSISEVSRFRVTLPAAPEEPQPEKPFRPVLDSSDLVITADAVVAPFSQDLEAKNKSIRVVALLIPADGDITAETIASTGISGAFGEDGKAIVKLTVTPSSSVREFDLVWVGVK
ncbi:hypothetical protein IT570_03350 [Candidatus Sumerlaeota bacterium]|nr:hypothetical protein [Candidatus Sumerlaeota bacterium]